MSEAAHIACSEVWGGNDAVEAALVLPGIEGWVLSRPWQQAQAGGDVHYISSCGTGRITRFLLADVAGHGDSAADAGHSLRRLMQRYLNHIDPRKLALRMNRDLNAKMADDGGFATALIMTYFSPDCGLTLCNAGHPAPLIFRSSEQAWGLIRQPDTGKRIANLPLGVLEESGYQGRDVSMQPGDIVIAFTDCLIEARNAQGKQLMADGLLETTRQVVSDPAAMSPRDVIASLLSRIKTDGYEMDDDLTVIALRCTERSPGAGWLSGIKGVVRSLTAPLRGRAFPWPEMAFSRK